MFKCMIISSENGIYAIQLMKELTMEFIDAYINEVSEICEQLDKSKINSMLLQLVDLKKRNGRLFILGVGGSAGNASHAVNDFRKLAGIESYAPTDNISEVTARTNDEGWETIFEAYLKVSNLNDKDCLLILSVGGGDLSKKVSVNLCRAIDFAKLRNVKILGITGKEDGHTHVNADVCLVIPRVNLLNITPHSEAFQAIIWHLLVSHPKLKVNSTKW
jgi:D-sedoheptulose 7-phosphate isomerase